MEAPSNPYVAGDPVGKHPSFVGREDVLRKVLRVLHHPDQNAVTLYGQRRTGKTSILQYLEVHLPEEGPYRPVYFDLMSYGAAPLPRLLQGLAQTIAGVLNLPPPDLDPDPETAFGTTWLPQALEALPAGHCLVLLMDEFDVLADREIDQRRKRAFFGYMRDLRRRVPPERLNFVFVLGRTLDDLDIVAQGLFKDLPSVRVSLLSRKEAERLVRLSERQGSLAWSDAAVERVWAWTAGHPYLTQALCAEVWEAAYEEEDKPPPASPEAVDEAVPAALERSEHMFTWLWEGLGPAEKVVAAALAEAGPIVVDDDRLGAILSDSGVRILIRELRDAPRLLQDWDILEPADGGYRFRVKLLRRWIALHHPLARTQDELDHIQPVADNLFQAARSSHLGGDPERAAGFLRQALELNPSHLGALELLAEISLAREELDTAQEALERLHDLAPSRARARLKQVYLKRAAAVTGDGEEAEQERLEWYERILTIAPDDLDALAGKERIEQARLERRRLEAQYRQAMAAMAQGDSERAISLLRDLIAKEPTYRQGEAAKALYKAVQEGRQRRRGEWRWMVAGIGGLVMFLLGVGVLLMVLGKGPEWSLAVPQISPTPTSTYRPTLSPTAALVPTPTSTPTATPVPTLTSTPTATSVPTPTPRPVFASTPVPHPVVALSPRNAREVVQLARWGKGTVNEVAWSPNQQLLAVASSLGVYLYDAKTLEEVRFFETEAWVNSIAFSPDGRLLASGSGDGTVQLWRVESGELVRTLKGHTSSVWSVAFSPDGRLLASGSGNGIVRLWRVGTGKEVQTLEGHTGKVYSVAFSSGGLLLASGSEDKMVRMWDVESGKLVRVLGGHMDSVYSVSFSPDDRLLASGSGDGTVRLWEVENGELMRLLMGHTDSVWSVAFSPDGVLLASGSEDNTIWLWEVETGRLVQKLEELTAWVGSIAFSPDGRLLASGSGDGTVQLWEVATGKSVRTLTGHMGSVWSVAFSPNSALLASGSRDNMVRLWEVGAGRLMRALEGHTDDVASVAFSPDGQLLASGSADGTVRLWEVETRQLVRTLEGHTGSVWSIAFSPGGRLLASGSWDRTVRLWDVETGKLVRTLVGHTDWVRSIAFSSDGSLLASGADDGTVRLWEVETGRLIRTFWGHTGSVWSVAFSPDGRLLASGSLDGTVRLWGMETGKLVQTLEGHASWVESIAFSPDSQLLASGSEDKTVRLWDVGGGEVVQTLEGHTGGVLSVTFSPDGRLLASGSGDGTVRLWGVGGP